MFTEYCSLYTHIEAAYNHALDNGADVEARLLGVALSVHASPDGCRHCARVKGIRFGALAAGVGVDVYIETLNG